MRRPVGVTVSGILLALLSVLGIACAGLALSAPLLVHRPLIPKLPGMQPGLWAMGIFFVLCLWAVVELFRMRPGARISMVLIGFIYVVASGLSIAGLLWLRDFVGGIPPGPNAQTVQIVFWAIITFFAAVALVGLWWVVYFLRAGAAFGSAGQSQQA
jgi:hypothetical protein